MAKTILCPFCKGQVGHSRGQTLPDALERHLPSCPGVVTVAKRKPPVVDVPLPEPPPKPRVRVIPRGDPPKSRKR